MAFLSLLVILYSFYVQEQSGQVVNGSPIRRHSLPFNDEGYHVPTFVSNHVILGEERGIGFSCTSLIPSFLVVSYDLQEVRKEFLGSDSTEDMYSKLERPYAKVSNTLSLNES